MLNMKTRDKKRKVTRSKANPLRVDPTRTTMLRAALARELSRKFARLRLALDELVVKDDAFGLKGATFNAFCPTGKGGGIDPTCSPGERVLSGDRLQEVTQVASQLTDSLKAIGFHPDTPLDHPLSMTFTRIEQYQQGTLVHKESWLEEEARKHPEIRQHFEPVREKIRELVGDHVTLYRGADEVGGIPGKFLSSYSPEESVASKFLEGYDSSGNRVNKVLKKVSVPIEAIHMVVKTPNRPLEFFVQNDMLPKEVSTNAFCPTGAGGGVDPTCGKGKPHTPPPVNIPSPAGLLKRLGDKGRKLKAKAKAIFKKLEVRYGKAGATAIFVSGQAISWGAFAVGAAVGQVIYVPSAVAMAPGAAIAEVVRAVKGKARAAAGTTNAFQLLSPSDIDRLAREVIAELTTEARRLGLVEVTANSFCPTGPGGGVDPTCSPSGARVGGAAKQEEISKPNLDDKPKPRKSKAQVKIGDTSDPRPTHQIEEEHRQLSESVNKVETELRKSVATPTTPENVREVVERENALRQDLSRLVTEQMKTETILRERGRIAKVMGATGVNRDNVASTVGAPDDANIIVKGGWDYETNKDALKVFVYRSDLTAGRTITTDAEGRKVVRNDSFFIHGKQGSGIGTRVFTDQVENLRELGFDRIETWAARGPGMNGYYTWPRLGYDQQISEFRDKRTRDRIKKAFPEAKSVLDIMATPEGRAWWKKNGTNMRKAKFDLKDGSRSLAVLDSYLKERKARQSPVGNSFYPLRNTELDNEDDIPPDSLEDAEEIEADDDGEVLLPSPEVVKNAAGDVQLWRFDTDAEKLKKFQEWLRQQMFLWVLGKDEEELWREYVERGYRKGAGRAFDDVKRAGATPDERIPFYLDAKYQFLRSAFAHPIAVEKVKLLVSRAFTDLKGVTEAMSTTMTRTLADGLVQGISPRDLGRRLAKDVDGIGRARATLIARTEIIRAHAEGQLDAMKSLGVEQVGARVEWSTTGDAKVCPMCRPLQGVVLAIDQARGMLPRHPNCRCAWIPAGVGEVDQGQVKTRDRIRAAVRRSVAAGSKKDRWRPAVLNTKTEDGPKATNPASPELVAFSRTMNVFCPTGEGGGVDPTCGKDDSGALKKTVTEDSQEIRKTKIEYGGETYYTQSRIETDPRRGKTMDFEFTSQTSEGAEDKFASTGKTGHRAVTVLREISRELDQSISSQKPDRILFQTEIDQTSKVGVYRRFAERAATKHGYELVVEEGAMYATFVLKKIKT